LDRGNFSLTQVWNWTTRFSQNGRFFLEMGSWKMFLGAVRRIGQQYLQEKFPDECVLAGIITLKANKEEECAL